MRALNSHSASRALLLLAGALFGALSLNAQEPWREGRNIGGITLYEGNEAQVQLGGEYTSGGFRTPSEAANLWRGGLNAQAETHYKDLVLTGAFSFDVKSGREMTGSMFTKPGFYPIDVLEFVPGTKTMQTYAVSGGMAWDTRSAWKPGIALRFEGINYAKRKDLRHTTYRQELEVVPSLLYKGDNWRMGLSAIFEKNSEFIQAEVVGAATSETYYAFLDKGRRYGTLQAWDGSGIHLAEPGVDRLAVNQMCYGSALQLSLGDSLYGDVEYVFAPGYVGEKGYTWFRFWKHAFTGKVIWNIQGNNGTHSLRADWTWSRQENYETVLDKVTSGGVTTPREYGSNRIFVQRQYAIGPTYSYESKRNWDASFTAVVTENRERGTHMYPYLEYDEGMMLKTEAKGGITLGPVRLDAGLRFRIELAEDHKVVDTDENNEGVTTFPFRLQYWWEMEEEFNDLSLLGGFLNIRYNFTIGHQYKFFVEAGCTACHAFEVEQLPGSNRQTTHLTLGYHF